MAKVLSDYEFSKRGPDPKYPWDEWFDGQVWHLVQGEDFDCKMTTMEVNIFRKARSCPEIELIHLRQETPNSYVLQAVLKEYVPLPPQELPMFQCECCGRLVGPRVKAEIRQVSIGAKPNYSTHQTSDGFVKQVQLPPAPQVRGVSLCADCAQGIDKGIPFSALQKQQRKHSVLHPPMNVKGTMTGSTKPKPAKKAVKKAKSAEQLIEDLEISSNGRPRNPTKSPKLPRTNKAKSPPGKRSNGKATS